MVEHDADELAMLTRAEAEGLEITYRRYGHTMAQGEAERAVAERLRRLGFLRYGGIDLDLQAFKGDWIALYSITELGLIHLELTRMISG